MNQNYAELTTEIYRLVRVIPFNVIREHIIPFVISKNMIVCSICKTIMQTHQQKLDKKSISWTIHFNKNEPKTSNIKCLKCFKKSV